MEQHFVEEPCQEGWHRPVLSLFAKVFTVFSCKLPKVTCFQKFAFAKRSGAMKAPVGLLSDRTVLRSKMEVPRPDKFTLTWLDFCGSLFQQFIAIFKNSAYQNSIFAICSLRMLLVH